MKIINDFKFWGLLLILLCSFSLVSCGLLPDDKIEKKLEGTWQMVEYENEDGMTMKIVETITYVASTNKFESDLNAYVTNPINKKMFSLHYSGNWSASKKKLINDIDKNSIRMEFSKWIDRSDRIMMERELKHELKETGFTDGGRFVQIEDDYFIIQDEEDGIKYRYERVDYIP